MGFDIPAEVYDKFMGRYSSLLSAQFADFAGVHPGQRALDVGCGPGALITELDSRLGADAIAAIDPSVSFVTAARERCRSMLPKGQFTLVSRAWAARGTVG